MAGGTASPTEYNQVVSLLGRASGLRYFEVVIANAVGMSGSGSFQIGLTTDNPPSTTQNLGVSAGGSAIVWSYPPGYVSRTTPAYFNLGTALSIGSVVKGALNFSTNQAWLGLVGGAWVGGGDPAAGTSPTLSLPAGTYYIASCSGGTSDPTTWAVRIRTGAAQFTGTVPSGFVAWAA